MNDGFSESGVRSAAAPPKIELLYFEGCPNAPRARENLRSVLEAMGAELSWREWDLLSDSTPAGLRAFGSPTVLIDGMDVTGRGGSGIGVACRADGAPSVEQIAAKLGGLRAPRSDGRSPAGGVHDEL